MEHFVENAYEPKKMFKTLYTSWIIGLTTAPCVKRKFQHNEMENSQDYSIHPLRITLGQLQEHHMVASRQQQCKVKSVQINHLHSKTSNTIGVDGSRAVIFPETRDRQSSREFAEQFHESVLQSIRQKDFQKKGIDLDSFLKLSYNLYLYLFNNGNIHQT